MGFTTGFTGGVTLTLSLAYLSVLAHQRTREQQGSALRAQALAIQGLIDPLPPLPPPTRSEVAAAQRAQTVEIAKDRWNTEVENAVRWVQHTDWVQVREGLEDTASRLWARAFGVSPSEAVGEAGRKGAAKLGDASGKVAAAAKGAFQKAKAESKDFASVVLDHSKDKENVDIAQEDGTLSALTPVERALQQRFSKPEDKVNKTVEEALNDRYKPMDARDNTQLRGV
ncbi:MICOS complex subunit Mic12 [Fusarium oxysporum f. sp. vasinfectum]|nr:MICOS complex subunit Mic12 [Fusarium oxysporum f. sp. vasinfectum]